MTQELELWVGGLGLGILLGLDFRLGVLDFGFELRLDNKSFMLGARSHTR